MVPILLILSLLGVLIGLFFLSEATFGVGVVAAAGVLAIWARIAQAAQQHDKLAEMLQKSEDKETAVTAEDS